jgi:hypothetical protein
LPRPIRAFHSIRRVRSNLNLVVELACFLEEGSGLLDGLGIGQTRQFHDTMDAAVREESARIAVQRHGEHRLTTNAGAARSTPEHI